MRSCHSSSSQSPIGFVLMVAVCSAAVSMVLLVFVPQFVQVYAEAGLRVPFLTAAFVMYRGAAVVWFVAVGCLFSLLPWTTLYRKTPRTVVSSVLALYVTLFGTLALSLCMPLFALVNRLG